MFNHRCRALIARIRTLFLFVVVAQLGAVCAGGVEFISAAQAEAEYDLPARGVWNGFLGHYNAVECVNLTSRTIGLRLTVLSNQGGTVGQRDFDLPANGTHHVVLNEFSIGNAYGTFRLDARFGLNEGPAVHCITAFYRLAPSGSADPVEYAFALPLLRSTTEPTVGTFNSYHPGGGPTPVRNWLSVVNLGTSNFAGNVEVYGQNGFPIPGAGIRIRAFELPPGARIDLPLGSGGQQAGLYRIRPDNEHSPYSAFLTRYSDEGGRYTFAFPSLASVGACDSGLLPASTMDPAMNWVEIANGRNFATNATLEVRDRWGGLLHSRTVQLKAYAQQHLLLNDYIGDSNVGSFRVKCVPGSTADAGLFVQSLHYGHIAASRAAITWAYASQSRSAVAREAERLVMPVNTFLSAANWVKAIDSSASTSTFEVALNEAGGKTKGRAAFSVFGRGALDFGAHELSGPNAVGIASVKSPTYSALLSAELLRVFPDGQNRIGYVMNVPARVGPTSDTDRGSVRRMGLTRNIEFRKRPLLIVGDSVSQGWMELGLDFDQESYLDALAQRGANGFMIWSFIGINDQVADTRIGYNAPRIWPWIEGTGASRPPYSFSFFDGQGNALFNEQYFDRLASLVKAANERDIVVLITIHDGWTKARFAGHPMNVANGGVLQTNAQYVEIADYNAELPRTLSPGWSRSKIHQFILERFVEKILNVTAGYPNVMYEVFNEGEWYNQDLLRPFQQHFVDFIRARTDLPVLVNTDALVGAGNSADELADVVSLHQPNWRSSTTATDAFEYYAARYFSGGASASKPLIFTEPVPEYRGQNTDAMMRLMWGTLLAGSSFFVPNDTRWRWDEGQPLDPIFARVGYAATFFNNLGVDFDRMVPSEEAATMFVNGFDVPAPCLALPGKQFVAYSSYATSVTIDLLNSPGAFSVRFFSPRVGAFHTTEYVISGGGLRTVSTPSIDDWAVWIVKQ